MGGSFCSERNLNFLLYEVFEIESLLQYERYNEHNKKVFDIVLKSAMKLAKDLFYPAFTEMDRRPPELEKGTVRVHPVVRKMLAELGRGGWISSTVPHDLGGEQLPHMMACAFRFIFGAANFSASVFPTLTDGAAHLIETFGDASLRETFVPNMRAGLWQGTMALTEAEAGSSLSDITTTAEPMDGGFYHIRGQKIFISAGDHDGVDNVVHLMLAKIKGAPAGVKGISLFVVPKFRVGDSGTLTPNDVVTSGLYHKMGYRGCPIVQLSVGDRDDCRGWLVGEPHQGLGYMFQMMNEARIGVGLAAASIASAAYHAALDYARSRRQGRRVGEKDPDLPQIPIIEHADVKRMLLFQRAVVEGSLSLLFQCARYMDLLLVLAGPEKEDCSLLLDLLTPVAKTYPSEMGILAISQGLQCFGGSGYCDDYPLGQYYRDTRIHPIHEGTTGIQGMDLLGRKVFMKNGAALKRFVRELDAAIAATRDHEALAGYARRLEMARDHLQEVTRHLMQVMQSEGAGAFLADATLYLEFFSIIAISWQWLLQGAAAQKALKKGCGKSEAAFYQGKLMTLRYFYAYELPKALALKARLMDGDRVTLEMTADLFTN